MACFLILLNLCNLQFVMCVCLHGVHLTSPNLTFTLCYLYLNFTLPHLYLTSPLPHLYLTFTSPHLYVTFTYLTLPHLATPCQR